MKIEFFVWTFVASLLLAGTALAGLDQSEGPGAENLSMTDFSALGGGISTDAAVLSTGAPQGVADEAGSELAVYTDQPPSEADQGMLQPSSVMANPPMYINYQGKHLGWKEFNAVFPIGQPGLWIERAAGWSTYATMPLSSWTKVLLYVPTPSSPTLYELYPSGFVRGYNLGYVNPGYYVVWYYADSPGRHLTLFASSSGYSNTVIIDVFSPSPRPTPPSPRDKCEQNPNCDWVNGHCYCRGIPPIDPEKASCEQNPECSYVNGHCYCRGISPIDPEKASCEQNPECSYVNGQCLCRGLNPPEPMPGPTPEEEACLQNPSCHYAGGNCYCMGVGGMVGGGIGAEDMNTDGGDSGETGGLLGNI
jgi:hypothetical protein